MRWICLCLVLALGQPALAYDQGDRAVVSGFAEPQSLHPLLELNDAQDLIFAGLVAFDALGNPYPDLALAVPSLENGGVRRLPDGRWQVDYELRQNARWQDGTPVTAEDVAFTWLVLRAQPAYQDVVSATAIAPWKARVILRKGSPRYLTLFRHLLPRHQLADNPLSSTWWPMGAGPFRLQHWEKGDRMTFLPHRDYHRGPVHLDQIQVLFRDDPQADVRLGLTAHQAHRLPGTEPFLMPIAGVETLVFNVQRLPDQDVRRGLVSGLNLQQLLREYPVPLAWSEQAPHSWGFNPQVVGRYGYDPERAKTAVSGLRPLLLLTTDGRETEWTVAHWLAEQWSRLGMSVTVHHLNEEALAQALTQGAYDVALLPRRLDWGPMGLWQWGGENVSRYSDPIVARWLKEMENTFSAATWRSNSQQVEARLTEDLPRYPLFYLAGWGSVHQRLHNFKSSPDSLFWNAYEWWKAH